MDIMKPREIMEIPNGEEWLYEVKYDGFRCILSWDKDHIQLTSKNNKDLTVNFPEIINDCRDNLMSVQSYLPLQLDGELVVLNNAYQANFAWIQKRSRYKAKDAINTAMHIRPATFMVFDLLKKSGTNLSTESFQARKQLLNRLFSRLGLATSLRMVTSYDNPDQLWQKINDYKGEGIVAKRKTSIYTEGKKHHDWFKIKNWRTIQVFLTDMHLENHYFTVNVYQNRDVKAIGKCKHGLDKETMETLKHVFLTKGKKQGNVLTLPPAICASVHTLDLYKGEIREPRFNALLPDVSPTDCTKAQLILDMAMLPPNIEITNAPKMIWPEMVTKGGLVAYVREVSPYMLPFLKGKLLTVIRAPDGIQGKHFFQKYLASYAPKCIDFVETDDGKRIVCNTLDTLIWLANHGAIEYHIPFQTIETDHPNEIIFDLDPPSKEQFVLAIQAANIIKSLLDELNLISFVKTSGNKGLQVHIPIPVGRMTYEETAIFTQAIAQTVEKAYSDLFTTERLKKNRQGRLYIDYVQHGKDKTLIAPYSPRKTTDATVATPLYWHEVKSGLVPEQFTINTIEERIKMFGCPFASYFYSGQKQQLNKVLKMING
ncbi:DNA ligase D [Amphibacillus cookii]|uniref:DNA ligase D n=1 Tax=Amphibacillus cookii TaxID=767787 RepID=UPI00195AC9A5|nr:DNA ligase D [Amphibacillus cookii]MBM7540136.1 bifunctional non-homologous end joining protein LigD [Amphibacillus cookii]